MIVSINCTQIETCCLGNHAAGFFANIADISYFLFHLYSGGQAFRLLIVYSFMDVPHVKEHVPSCIIAPFDSNVGISRKETCPAPVCRLTVMLASAQTDLSRP